MKKIFERLVEERKRLKLNKGQMASAGNVANSTYTNYEEGSRSPDGEFFAAIAAAGADILYILTGKHSFPAQAPSSLDVQTLEYVIASVESNLNEHRKTLTPSRKAVLIQLLYEHCLNVGKRNDDDVKKFFKLVA